MKQEKLHIKDDSGDKEFFTIIPNYILNNSTAVDQALYLQLKRLAGDGKRNYCYPSYNYLMEKLHLRRETIKKSLKYLIKHKWIDSLGKRQVMTAGGYQWVNAYQINNIWAINTEFYKGASQIDPLPKGLPKSSKVRPKTTKGLPVVSCKEERNKNVRRTASSFKKKKKPYFRGEEMRKSKGKWWVLPKDNSYWLEFAGKEKEIVWK